MADVININIENWVSGSLIYHLLGDWPLGVNFELIIPCVARLVGSAAIEPANMVHVDTKDIGPCS